MRALIEPWIIEELRKQEERKRQEILRREYLEVPLPPSGWEPVQEKPEHDDVPERGIVIIDFS